MPGRKALGSIVAVVAVAACSVAIRAGADFESGANLAPYRTFAWGEPDNLPTGDPRLDNNPFFVDRLHEAITSEMSQRGFQLTEGSPDLLIHHHASVRSRIQVYDVDQRAGYDAGEYGPGSDVYEYEEGTFLVDIADASAKRILWRGWAQADIEAALADPDRMRDLVDKSVRMMFEEFPVAEPAS